MTFTPKRLVAALFSCGLVSLLHAPAMAGIDGLDYNLPTNVGAAVMGLSGDGNVAVGTVRLDAFNYRAYKFSPGGNTQLDGPAGYEQVVAQAASTDGSVVAGWALPSYSSPSARALVWNGATMTQLPDLASGPGTIASQAWAIAGDGRKVAGFSYASGGGYHAVRWLDGAAGWSVQDLNGGAFTSSFGRSIDASGDTVVGYGSTMVLGYQGSNLVHISGQVEEAFVWTPGGGMQGLGVLASDNDPVVGTMTPSSRAYAVSADGSTVVGISRGVGVNDIPEAFRWTAAGGMLGLGTLNGGTYSIANGVNADGSVVVGSADQPTPLIPSIRGAYAFRWTAAGGLQTVSDWLTANGVAVGSNTFSDAVAVDASGNAVIGKGQIDGRTQSYLARVSGGNTGGGNTGGGNTGGGNTGGGNTGGGNTGGGNTGGGNTGGGNTGGGSGVIGLTDFNRSLALWQQALNAISQRFGLNLWGAHHRTLIDSGVSGERGIGFWATGDYAHERDGDGRQVLGEFGVYHDLTPNLRWGVGVGRNDYRQDQAFGGRSKADGSYLVLEADYAPGTRRDWVYSVTGLYGRMDTSLRRGYLNAGVADASTGTPDATSWALRLRVDRYDAWRTGEVSWSPFVAYTHVSSKLDSYTETGGGFPVAYGSQQRRSDELRGGLVGRLALGANTDLRASGELVVARNRSGGSSGLLLGAGGFAFNTGSSHDTETWGRLGLEIDHRLTRSAALATSVNVASDGNDPQWSGSVGVRVAF
ncbi:autotransporter domain-containing protein [Azonexus caeni]|uniref:autotransporter domain-containing protein n=1 Tax=Azonexus caeni TaxID=266126 RepID=UPI003A8C557C